MTERYSQLWEQLDAEVVVYGRWGYWHAESAKPIIVAALDELAAEVEQLRDILRFADGFVVSNTGDTCLADLYNETTPKQQVMQRAGCWPRNTFRAGLEKETP